MIRTLLINKYLVEQLIKNDIEQRYKGSILGILWSIMVPIIMLCVYTFVFGEVFQAKWEIDTGNKYQFALVLFCGLSTFNMVSEVMSRSTTLIASNVNYVKKVIFPLELLPFIITISALFNCGISFMILLIAKLLLTHTISCTIYQIFFAFIPLIVISIGIGLIISALSVYLKDIANIISVLVTILMYMSPVFFPLSGIPEKFRFICLVNPMTYLIENFRNVTLYGENLNLSYYLISLVCALVIYKLGYALFKRAQIGFADIL